MSRQPTILLLQARDPDDPARLEEVRAFADRCGVDSAQITPWDLLQGAPALAEVRRRDVLMIGGAGDYYVSKGNLPHFPRLMGHLQEVAETGHPTFASCFGFQCLVVALGGEIIHDPENTEVGTLTVTLTEAGLRDELFGDLPQTFLAQLGHKDRAPGPAAGTFNLAASERCPVQALRIPGKPIWATQFHPELDKTANRSRYEAYLDGYAAVMSPEERQAALDSFRDSPETGRLLAQFLELVLE